jgi:uncharacterized protein
MKWGIVTDTHDKTKLVKASISIFETLGCEHVFHCGDFNQDRIAALFTGRKFTFHYVTDHTSHDKGMKKFKADVLDERIGDNSVYAFHDTYPVERPGLKRRVRMVEEAIDKDKHDFVLYGHLHYFNLKFPSRRNETVALNAGGFYHEELSTFCVVDMDNSTLDLYFWDEGVFTPILRFDLMSNFESMQVLHDEKAHCYAQNLNRLRWTHSDKMERDFSREGIATGSPAITVSYSMG